LSTRKTQKKQARETGQDPYAEREANKYSRPIPSREFIMHHLESRGVPLAMSQLARELGLKDNVDQEALRRRLNAMERDGQLLRNRRGGYGLVSKMDMVRGRVVGHPDGFGFLDPDEGGDGVFLGPREMRSLMHGDRAMARVCGVDARGRREGTVVDVLERNTQQVVGRFHRESGQGFVVPDNKRIAHDIVVPAALDGEAGHGQIVVVDLMEQPSRHSRPVGRVAEILGDHLAPGMEIDIALRAHEVPHQWPVELEAEVQSLSPEVSEAAKAGRVDLRRLPLVTIDGPDARDFDDAVYCETKPKGGWRLWVAIADVSHYVRTETALDREALRRGNSVYFPDRVIPMLPEVLSNGLCSLNPQVDRLCMVCEMTLGAKGKVSGYRFYRAVMRSAARLTYDTVAAILVDGDPALRRDHAHLLTPLETMYAAYRAMQGARAVRGAIDFDTTETRIEFGAGKKIERIVPLYRNDAHRLIEELMVAANTCAAGFLLKEEMPTLYRVHGGPGGEKLTELREFLAELGLRLRGAGSPSARDFAEVLEQVRDRPDRHLIETVMLRSLSQAVYSPENIGHFGLALKAYAHYTSPIRRYPDLLVHRAIGHRLDGCAPQLFTYGVSQMEVLGDHCSGTERRADEATRDAIDWLKCEYMLDKVGEVLTGTVSAVTSFGLFVELDEIYVEGLVHVTALSNDYYHFDPTKHRLTGERTRTVYRLADRLTVRVVRVDLDERKIDFELAEVEVGPPRRRVRRTRQGKR